MGPWYSAVILDDGAQPTAELEAAQHRALESHLRFRTKTYVGPASEAPFQVFPEHPERTISLRYVQFEED